MHGKMEWDSIKVDLEDIGWEDVGTVYQGMDKDKMAGSCDRKNYPSGSQNLGDFLMIRAALRFSKQSAFWSWLLNIITVCA